MTLVSACLLGINCRYDGKRREIPVRIKGLLEDGECLIPVCPEQLGGLTTPRAKNLLEWKQDEPRVINEEGRDVTSEFIKGAEETTKIARLFNVSRAYFKSRSPSCGEEGVATRMLREEGVDVVIVDADPVP